MATSSDSIAIMVALIAAGGALGGTVGTLLTTVITAWRQDERERRAALRSLTVSKRERLQPLYEMILRAADTATSQAHEKRIVRLGETVEERNKRHETAIVTASGQLYEAVLAVRVESGATMVVNAAVAFWSTFNAFQIDYNMSRDDPSGIPADQVWGHMPELEKAAKQLEAAIQDHLHALEQLP
jgi:hypothetical protein